MGSIPFSTNFFTTQRLLHYYTFYFLLSVFCYFLLLLYFYYYFSFTTFVDCAMMHWFTVPCFDWLFHGAARSRCSSVHVVTVPEVGTDRISIAICVKTFPCPSSLHLASVEGNCARGHPQAIWKRCVESCRPHGLCQQSHRQ